MNAGTGRKRFVMIAAAAAFSVLALLIWGKLKLVAGIPRTALAEPRQAAPSAPPAARPSRAASPAGAAPSAGAARPGH
jgi:hypothetical protein